MEASRARGFEKVLTLQREVADIESKLGIELSWTEEHPEWMRIQKNIAERDYNRVIDRLEGLAVARLFELSKAFQAGTGRVICTTSYPILTQCVRIQASFANRQGPTDSIPSTSECH